MVQMRLLTSWALSLLPSTVAAAWLPQVPPRYSGEAQKLADPAYGPIPGDSDIYSSYWGVDRPFPGNITDPIFPTQHGPPGQNDDTWQNLLSAEWVIFSFYQQGIERFTDDDFIKAGMPNTTRRRLLEIRNNEAGHLRIFQNQISPTSVKPGACKYSFPFNDPISYMAVMTVVEISSMAFLSGLVQQPRDNFDKGAMVAIAETETRHEVWALMDIWHENPFGGPSDTVFPYANQVLYTTNAFIVPGSCPPENPPYPHPRQLLPFLSAAKDTKSLAPGSTVRLNFTDPSNQPCFDHHTQYYAVFCHGVHNVSVPIVTTGWPKQDISVTIPDQFEPKGIIVALIANKTGAPTFDTVVAGPAVILEQPLRLGPTLL
ncbi:hypothetical protein VTK26DRAFT_2698 [Humicola hyalothermophila]